MLEVRNLRAGYGAIPVLMGLSLTVGDGEFVGILGHNGMGKTTLLKTLIGVLPETSGDIVLAGKTLSRSSAYRRARAGIGYVPQGRGILANLTALDNLRFAAAAVGKDMHAIERVLEEFPRLRPLAGRNGGALSGGEQQLLALARALVQEPRIILLDEPTEGIQPSIIEEIVVRLQVLRRERGLTILLVEQNVDFIKALSDRVLLIQKGSITSEFAVDALTDSVAMGSF